MTKPDKQERNGKSFRLDKRLTPYRSANKIALIYLIFGALWILVSDRLLGIIVTDPQLYIDISIVKGWIYVAITTAIIYGLVVSTLELYEEAKSKVIKVNDDLQIQLEKTVRSEKRFELAVKGSFDSIWEYDIVERTATMSDPLLRNLGYGPQDRSITTLQDWFSLVHPDDMEMFNRRVEEFQSSPLENFEFTYRVLRKNGDIAWIRTHGSASVDGDGKIVKVAGSHSDVTLSQTHQNELTRFAFFDSLTGLMNWHGFSDLIQERIQSSPDVPFALLSLDIDDFKNVNDIHGYSFGDLLLKEISAELSQTTHAPDRIANLGGDGFGFLLEFENALLLQEKIDRIYVSFRKMRMFMDQSFHLYASVGIAFYPQDSQTFVNLMQCADEAMYEAKDSGKNTIVYFSEDIHARRIKTIAMIHDLRKAVENDELSLMYQPVYRLDDLRLSSLEALVRWTPKGKAAVSPDVFIPLAESSGLIAMIERWVFEHVFLQVVAWRTMHAIVVPVAINLSSRGIVNDTFIADVVELMKKYAIRPGEVEVEVTETGLIEGYDEAVVNLLELRRNGVKILLDDFGKGYSSLTHLVKLPIDVLKIDIGFTSRIHSSKEIDSVIKTIVDLAHSINLEVIAEGIEFEYQREFLQELRADFGQGYHLHRPAVDHVVERLF